MAFSQTDLDSIDAALVSLAAGDRIERLTIGSKTLYQSQITESGLLKIREFVARQVNTSVKRVYARQVKTR